MGTSPFMDALVMSPSDRPASACLMSGFTARPATFCRMTLYFEPVERHLFFALVNVKFTLIGKLCEIGGGRLRIDISETRDEDSSGADARDAIRIGFLSLLVNADYYFPGKARQALLLNPAAYPLICRGVPSVLDSKGWLDLSAMGFADNQGEWVLSEELPLLEGFDVRSFIATYFEGSLSAMSTLEKGQHWRDLFVLLQCAIDNLAWLSRPHEEHVTGSDFCRWVHQHLRLRGNAPLTAGEVYAWRCQWVHTYGGQPPMGNGLALADQLAFDYLKDDTVTVVGVRNLLDQYREALAVFATHCSLDSDLRTRVNKRLTDMPRVCPFALGTDGHTEGPK